MEATGSVILRIVCGIFLFGVMLFSLFSGTESAIPFSGDVERIEGTVFDLSTSDRSQKMTLTDVVVGEVAIQERVLVYAPLFPPLSVDDRVRFACELNRPEPFNGFRYDRYLAAKRIYAVCYLHEAPLVVGHIDPSFRSRLLYVREQFIQRIDMLFGEPHASLLNGLILGEQRFSEEWDDRFQATGTSHIVAASGYNVSMVTRLVLAFLISIGMMRPRAFAFLAAAIVLYVFLAGAEPPVVRAGVMGFLVLTSQQLGRRTTMTNVLLVSACVMLAFNPRLLRDDVGFQLSFVSTAALIYLAPRLESTFRFLPETFAIRENVVATLAATMAALPILFLSFGSLSFVSPIANVLILPLAPLAMALGAIAGAVGLVSTTVASYLAGPAWALLTLILAIVRSLAELPFFLTVPEFARLPLGVLSVCFLMYLWRYLGTKRSFVRH